MGPWILPILLFFATVGLVGLYLIIEVPQMVGRRLRARSAARAALGQAQGRAWEEGEDLLRYPRRLEALQEQLESSMAGVEARIAHIGDRVREVGEKEGRADIVNRYREDGLALERRLRHMERVLALVWRTRAALGLRAHLAITARKRPVLDALPGADVPREGLDRAARTYQAASADVRRFVGIVSERRRGLAQAVPPEPGRAPIGDDTRAFLETERQHVDRLYADLHERMDQLADVLGYLADRCLTRQVIEGATAELAGGAEGERLVEVVSQALGSLNEMARAGDLLLADDVVDNLAEDIGQLEKAGLEAQAETDAALEVARLLEEFKR